MTEHFKLSEYVGAKTLNAAKKTRLWALASALDHVLYSATKMTAQWDAPPDTKVRVFAVPLDQAELLYLGSDAEFGKFPGVTQNKNGSYYADVGRLLRVVQHELERLAVLEVTQ